MTYEKSSNFRGTAEFIHERRYLQNVTTKTIDWYGQSFRAFEGCLDSLEALKTRITEMRMRGVSATSVNTYLRCIGAFWKWQGRDWKVPRLKQEQKVLATLTSAQVSALIKYRSDPGNRSSNIQRAQFLTLTILDTGLRASEALSLKKEDVDLENLVLKVRGKGNKQRLVPFSYELRKTLYRNLTRTANVGMFVFGTKHNSQLTVRNFERDLKVLGQKCGITGVRFSPHTLRHTMAASYLRHGGDLYFLSRILGHSSVKTTEIYLRSIGIDDLKRRHSELSLLSRG